MWRIISRFDRDHLNHTEMEYSITITSPEVQTSNETDGWTNILWLNEKRQSLEEQTTMSVAVLSTTQLTESIEYLRGLLSVTRFVVQKVLTPSVIAFGVICNLVTIAVLSRFVDIYHRILW